MLQGVSITQPNNLFDTPTPGTVPYSREDFSIQQPRNIFELPSSPVTTAEDDYTPVSTETLEIYPTKPQALNIRYRNREAVEVFIQTRPQIWPFIEAATPFLIKHFGQPLEIVLEVMSFPEEGAEDELVAWIQSSDEVEIGLDKLEKFKDEWFLDRLEEVDYRFNFNLEFYEF